MRLGLITCDMLSLPMGRVAAESPHELVVRELSASLHAEPVPLRGRIQAEIAEESDGGRQIDCKVLRVRRKADVARRSPADTDAAGQVVVGVAAAAVVGAGAERVFGVVTEAEVVGAGAVGVVFDNTVHLGTGPLVHLARWPTHDEPAAISLTRVTVRGAKSVLACDNGTADAGMLQVEADDCVFAPRDGGALIAVHGRRPDASRLRSIRWSGQGSVISSVANVGVYVSSDGSVALDDAR